MFRLLRRIAQKHLLVHLIIPLFVGILAEVGFAYRSGKINDWNNLREYLFSLERFGLFVGVFLTYLFLMYFFIRKDTDIGLKRLALAELEETLDEATGYFAVGTISLKEWFDPATEVYLASILRRKFQPNGIRHERVLFFFTRADIKNLTSPYLDGYYAKCLKEIHMQFGVPLAFLERTQIFQILNKLSITDRKLLRLYRWPFSWLPDYALQEIHLNWLRRKIRGLSFSLVELKCGTKCIIRFSKNGQSLGLERVDHPDVVKAYELIV
jgi:hypothetical protein